MPNEISELEGIKNELHELTKAMQEYASSNYQIATAIGEYLVKKHG